MSYNGLYLLICLYFVAIPVVTKTLDKIKEANPDSFLFNCGVNLYFFAYVPFINHLYLISVVFGYTHRLFRRKKKKDEQAK